MPQPPPTKPEVEVLLSCARNPLDAGRQQRLAALLASHLDWPLMLNLAVENGLLPLLCEHLSRYSQIQIPGDISNRLREENRQYSMRSLLLMAELLRIVNNLRQRQIPALPYKGPTLAQFAYGNPSLRQFEDLDIVVAQQFMPRAYDEMNALGYEARLPRKSFLAKRRREIPGEYVFLHKQNRALVEFHTEFTLRHFPSPPRIDEMARRPAIVCVNGREVPTFSPADNLLMLCVHGAKDFWSRLIWVADVAAIAEKLSAADWQRLLEEADRYDASRMVNLGLCLAHSIFQTQPPSEFLQRVRQDVAVRSIASQFRDQLLVARKLPDGILWRSRYRIAMVQGFARGVRYWLRLSTAPAEEDWSAADFRSRSGVASSFFRPLRLWRKYAGSRAPE
ncbi:MAG TPA: nucleotidyltransferase family protein [Candidatus Acidoferrales bacterium]|nr:nucleotidyltransferase family protein [Candidatus Acidoferrales bacterium]